MKRLIAMIAVLGAVGFTPHALAVGTAASTEVNNTANATFTVDGNDSTVPSNEVTFLVDEILDVDVQDDGVTTLASPGDTGAVTTFTVTNTGNGVEDYVLTVDRTGNGAADDFDPTAATPVQIYIDDGDGIFDPATDTPFDPAVDTLTLDANDPDADDAIVFVLHDIPAGQVSGDTALVDLTATSQTKLNNNPANDDVAGAVYENEGDAGVDAVVGPNNASDTDTGDILVNDLDITLVKRADKVAGLGTLGLIDDGLGNGPDTGVVEVPGDTIRYTLTFTVTGDGTVDDLFITDAIPFDATTGDLLVDYVTGSLTSNATLDDGTTATDTPSDSAADADGGFQGTIPAGNPNATRPGVVFNVEQLLGITDVTVTTAGSGFTLVVTFDVTIPDGSTP